MSITVPTWTLITLVSWDKMMVFDISDGSNIKDTTIQAIADFVHWDLSASDVNTALWYTAAATTRKLDNFWVPDDNTDLNSTTSYHWLLPKLLWGTTKFLREDWTWEIPAWWGWSVTYATAWEINTGTETAKAVNPDGLAWSNAFTKTMVITVIDPSADVTTWDGKAYVTVPDCMTGMNLIRAQATVVTAWTTNATTVMVYNLTDTVDMLSWAISIASWGTVGTVWTIDTSNDDVATNDILRIDVDSVSTTEPKGLTVILEFRLP